MTPFSTKSRHSKSSSDPDLLGLQSSAEGELSMGGSVEELREAAGMQNDAVRERGPSQSHEQTIQELLSKVRKEKDKYRNPWVIRYKVFLSQQLGK